MSLSDAVGIYDGETALHIAIVNRDYTLVRFLVEVSKRASRI